MKLSFPRLAVRSGLGESLCLDISTPRSLQSPPTLRSLPAPSHQHQPRCSRRYISNATASLQQEGPTSITEPSTSEINEAKTTSPTSKPAPSISEQVRLLMRRVPYPVAIITATDPTGPADTTSFRGMTVSSFNTVTLTPHPVISFNVRRPSETLNALLASRRFLVHLLGPGPATATLARDFSKGNTTLAAMLSGHGEFEFGALGVDSSEAQVSGGEVERPLPLLRRRIQSSDASGSNRRGSGGGFPFVFECTLHPHKIDVHDHSIVLGTVVRAIEGSDALLSEGRDEHSPDRLCLTYANTKFWKMGSEI